MKIVKIYTDGSGSKNVKDDIYFGGFGFVMLYGKHKKEFSSDCYYNTTNQRMEIMAVIEALKYIKKNKKFEIVIFSDSQYVVNTINKWLKNWIIQGVISQKANDDLWIEFNEIYNRLGGENYITTKWIRGHDGNKWNEIADELAVKAKWKRDKIIYDNIIKK